MERGRNRRQDKGWMISSIIRRWRKATNKKASERFHRKPYQSYSVEDYLKKMGIDVTKGVDAGGSRDWKKTILRMRTTGRRST